MKEEIVSKEVDKTDAVHEVKASNDLDKHATEEPLPSEAQDRIRALCRGSLIPPP